MKKLPYLFILLFFALFFSCKQITNESTRVRISFPKSESRSVGASYNVSDIAKYVVYFDKDSKSTSYECAPGEYLYIESIAAGNYVVRCCANDANGNCIAYGTINVEIIPDILNEFVLQLRKIFLTI